VAPELAALRKTYNISLTITEFSALDQYQEDITISVAELWRCVQKNAYTRGILFTLSEADFERLIIQSCIYCGFHSASRLNGIDRIDNNKGYLLSNCIPCCKMCNVIKNMQHPLEFLDKVNGIVEYYLHKRPISEQTILKWMAYLSTRKRETYREYITHTKRIGLEFMLSEREYKHIIQGKCYLCGIVNRINHSNGIDRFDSSIRCYSIENSRTCCGHCNVMKGTLSYSDFIHKCIQICEKACDRAVFLSVPIYDVSKCRNESYTAEEIRYMMTNGKYSNYLEWCKENNKSPEFISAMNEIHHRSDVDTPIILPLIVSELEKERSRKAHADDDKKNMHCTTLYCYLTQGKKDNFLDWYDKHHNKTSLFDTQFEQLLTQIPTVSKEKGIELCKKFMYDEKNRRNSQLRRERETNVVVYSKPSSKIENTVIYPTVIESMAQKVELIQEQKGYQKIELPKQWKTKQIYEFIQENKENEYKLYCEEHNTIPQNWDETWGSFVLSVKGKSMEESDPIIKAFVENLRRLRHNALCAKDTVEREDREQWPAVTVTKAFIDGKLDKFKANTEAHVGENVENPKWIKRWSQFVDSLEQNRQNEKQLKDICSKFMTAQRTKKYRAKNKSAVAGMKLLASSFLIV
jgi:organic radical activating enzyme